MKLLDYIKSHNDWEELLSHDPYNLKISRDNGYIMFKYDQIASDFSAELYDSQDEQRMLLEKTMKKLDELIEITDSPKLFRPRRKGK